MRHQPLHVGFGQCRRRLVHDQHAGILRQRARDLDPLAVADRQARHLLVDVEVAAVEGVEKFARAPTHGLPVDGAERGLGRLAEEDVLGDGQFGKQQQFLVHRGDAGGVRILGRGELHGLAVHENLALVRPGEARP